MLSSPVQASRGSGGFDMAERGLRLDGRYKGHVRMHSSFLDVN